MNNYKEITIEGKKYIRAEKITIHYQLNQIPMVEFDEHTVYQLEDGKVMIDTAGILRKEITNFLEQIPLLNPETGEVIRNPETAEPVMTTFQEIYVMIYSTYIHLASLRDNPPVQP